jgi:hypothetical protein
MNGMRCREGGGRRGVYDEEGGGRRGGEGLKYELKLNHRSIILSQCPIYVVFT